VSHYAVPVPHVVGPKYRLEGIDGAAVAAKVVPLDHLALSKPEHARGGFNGP
jgi:hypothetical protein